MRQMDKEERKQIEFEIRAIMEEAVSDNYAFSILEQENETTGKTFMEDVIENVMETSAWNDRGFYNDSDIKFAIGRIFMERMDVNT